MIVAKYQNKINDTLAQLQKKKTFYRKRLQRCM